MKKLGVIVDKAHNEYLQIAATMGVPALVVYLLFILLIMDSKMKTMFSNKITFVICLSIIGYLVQAFFNISTIGVAPLLWFMLGLLENEQFLKDVKI